MNKKEQWLAFAIIIIGIIMLLNQHINLLTAAALILLTIGMVQVRKGDTHKGHRYLAIGGCLLLLGNLMIVFLIVLASLAYFYSKNKKMHLHGDVMRKQNFWPVITGTRCLGRYEV
ncbi:hypothetical protein N6H13_21785 [Paenibacillus sp. CC-CFT742]|nr:hypothetical protein [Paenibacillus sp. CC-CFT742]WJH27790.1 hypothetical protein N6H13_21785 [Paenibacillus sp. CC-CFT742]